MLSNIWNQLITTSIKYIIVLLYSPTDEYYKTITSVGEKLGT